MSRPVREIVVELASTGLTPDQLALVAELAVAAAADASGGRSKHAEAQARYHARKRSELIISDQNDQPDQVGSPPHEIINSSPPTPSSKPKRVSRSAAIAIEVPDRPTEKAINFAVSHGWDLQKIQTEWQRFRDHSLAKGKKHRDVDAAWRNWVTSPFQATGKSNGQHATSSVADAFDRLIARAEGSGSQADFEGLDDLRVVSPEGR